MMMVIPPYPEPLRAAILSMDSNFLEQLFCLPEGYNIIACFYNCHERLVYFTLSSDALPAVQQGHTLPQATLSFTVDTLPDQSPEYKRITTEVQIR